MSAVRELYDYDKAAKLLDISPSTLAKWVCQRRIKVVKLGSRVRFTPEILNEFIERSTQEAIR